MPKLPRIPGRRLARVLERAGFVLARVRGDHAYYSHPQTGRNAVVPLTTGVLPVGTIANVLRQAGLAAQDLRKLLD